MASVLFFTLELLNQKDKLSHNQYVNNLKKNSQNSAILERYKTTDQENENWQAGNLGANRQI